MAMPSQSDLIAAIRKLLDAFAEPTEDGAREERCLLAIERQRELLDQADVAGGRVAFSPSAMRMH